MASVDDAWYVERKTADGSTRREPSARHGQGKRWVVRWRDLDSKACKRSFDRKADAEREAASIETDLARGTYIDPRAGTVSFRDYAEQWLASQYTDPSTTYQVGHRLRRHVHPVLGHLSMQAITPSHIRRWQSGLTVSRTYQRSIFANVSQIFTAAVADEIITKNPCNNRTVRKPTADPRLITPWTATQVAAVHAALPPRYAVLVPLAVGTGLRQGEIFGLSPDDIDLHRGTITVRRQVKLTPTNQLYFALPKGRKIRTLPLPDSVAEHLRAHLERHPAVPVALPWDTPDGPLTTAALLLSSRESRAVNRHYFNAKIWKPALSAANVPPIRSNGCHALRHYYASVLLDGGESIKTVSERLGHADPGFTLRTYTHLLPQSETRTRAIIDAALRPFSGAATPANTTGENAATTASLRRGPVKPRRAPNSIVSRL